MKSKFSMRVISIVLSLLMIVTSIPISAISASAADDSKYLFAYFIGDDDTSEAVNQRIRFALSEDGVNFTALNNGAPILQNSDLTGTYTWNNKSGMSHTKGVRDPFIIKKPDSEGYYVVATDLRVGQNGGSYNNSKIIVWDIDDLSKADQVHPWAIETSGMFGNEYYSLNKINSDYVAWAPEVVYDYQNNVYMMYWSGPLYAKSTILSAYTKDFKAFYQDASCKNLIDGNTYKPNTFFSEIGTNGSNTIDADIVYDGSNYYMVYKRESEKQLYLVKSDTLSGFSGKEGTRFYDSRYTGANGNNSGLEGPELYQRNDGKWTLIADNYTANTGAGSAGKYVMYVADSIDQFMQGTDYDCSQLEVATNISDLSPRHGGMTTITSSVYDSLNQAYGNSNTSDGTLVARYFTSSDTTADATGHGYTLSIPNSGVDYVSEFNGVKNAVHFNASTSNTSGSNPIYAKVRTNQMMSDYKFNYENGMTIKFKAYDELNDGTSGYTGFFSLTENSDATPGTLTEDTTNYSHFATAYAFLLDGMCHGVSSGTAGKDNGSVDYSSNTAGNTWVDYTVVFSGQTYSVYRDGAQIFSMNSSHINADWYNRVFDDGTFIFGSTLFSPDKNYKGYLSDIRIYSTGNQSKVDQIDDELSLPEKKQYVIDNINNTKSYTYVTSMGNSSNVNDTYMKNIVYTSDFADDDGTTFSNFSDSSSTKNNFKVAAPSLAVGLYTGSGSDIRFPMIARNSGGGTKTGVSAYLGIDHVAYSDSNFAVGGEKWNRASSWNNFASNSDNSHDFFTSASGNVSRSGSTNNGRFGVTEDKMWAGYMKYTGSGNTSTYYDALSNPTFAYQADYTWSWWSWGTKWGNAADYTGTVPTSNKNFYVLNIVPLKTLIESDAFKNNFNNVVNNEWKYTEDSLADYYKMYYDMLSFDPAKKDLSTASGVVNVANTIKSLVSSYYSEPTSLKKFNISYTFADGTVQTKTITAGDELGAIPANTAVTSNNNGTHNVYSWNETNHSSTEIPHNDVNLYETFIVEDCSFNESTSDGVTTSTCTVCGYTKTEKNFDFDAYNAAVKLANDEIANTAKYTEASRNALQTVLDNNKSENANKQSELDAMTKAIQEAINALELNSYTVNLYYVIDGQVSEIKNTVSGNYGEYFTFAAPSGNYTVEKWTRTLEGGVDEKVGDSNESLTGRFVGNADYYVYAKAVKSAVQGSAVVSLKDRLGRVVDNMYVTLNDEGKATLSVTVDTANNAITVNDTTMTALNVTFYKLTGFEINGQTVTDGTYEITGNTTITAVYSPASTFTITTDSSCTSDVTTAYWDQKVTVTAVDGTETTKWYVNDQLVGYGPTYSFRANNDVTVRCENTAEAVTPSAAITRLSYNSPSAKTITAVAQLNVPEGYSVKEAGVLLKTSSVNSTAAVDNIDNYTGSNANAKKFKANNFVKDTNQYVISVYASKTYDALYVGAVAYVTYTDSTGNETTAYSNLVTYEYKA